jgi:hypothetical protein
MFNNILSALIFYPLVPSPKSAGREKIWLAAGSLAFGARDPDGEG